MSVSINTWLAVLAALALVLGTVGRTSGETVIDYNTTIDSAIYDDVHVVEGANPNPPTVVDVEARIIGTLSAFDSSIVNLRLGSAAYVDAHDSSTVNVFDGWWGAECLWANGSSTVNMSGGNIEMLFPYDSSTVNMSSGYIEHLTSNDFSTSNISGGHISCLYPGGSSTVNISGGWISNDLWAAGSSTVNVFDGQVDEGADAREFGHLNVFGGYVPSLDARDSSRIDVSGGTIEFLTAGWPSAAHDGIITIAGSGFNFPYGAIPEPSGTLTGTLANGDPINAGFEIYSNASIVLVPEPSTFILLSMAAAGLALRVWRRRRH